MNYLPRNRSRHSFLKPVLFLVGVFIFGFFLLRLVGGVLISAATPLWKSENLATAKLSWISDYFRTKGSLMEENNSLRSRVSALELEIASRFSGPAGGASVLEMFGRRESDPDIISTVLVRPPQTPYDTLTIDAGEEDGIRAGAVVSMPEGPVLGTVSEVFKSSAKIKLFSAGGEKTAAILERHGVPVTVEGIGGGNFRIVLSRETEVLRGDRILSADIASNLLGVVGEIIMEPTDSFKEALVISPANIFEVHYVVVER